MFAAYAADAANAAHHAGPFYLQPEFWVAAAFILVAAGIFRPVTRGIAAALDMRAEKIRLKIEEAEKLKEEAQRLLDSYRRKQQEAMKEAEDIIAHAKAEAQRLGEQAAKDLAEALKRREQQALDRINQAEAQALTEVRNATINVAFAAAQQLIAQGLSADQAKTIADQAIKDLQGKLH